MDLDFWEETERDCFGRKQLERDCFGRKQLERDCFGRKQLERLHGRVVRAARLWCRKSSYRVSLRLGCAMLRLENSLCQPSRKWVPFSNFEG